MKKLFLIISSIFLISIIPSYAFAANPYESTGNRACETSGFSGDSTLCAQTGNDEEAVLQGKVGNVISAIFGIIGVLAVIFIIIGGYKYTTSQGDPEKLHTAKNTIMYSIIGLLVTIFSFAITSFALNTFTGDSSEGGGEGGGGSGTPVTAIEITSGTSVKVGETLQIKVKFTPDYATDKTLAFASSDTSVATVSDKGLVTGKKEGTTTITAQSHNGKTATAKITVEKKSGGSSSSTTITLDPKTVSVKVGESVTIKATVKPSGTVTWSSSDTKIATVNKDGVVKGVKKGKATITAKSGSATATASVTVGDATVSYAATFEKRSYTHSNGLTYEYWINIPEGAKNNMPIVIFLHGDGEMGNANKVKNLKQVQYIKESKGFIGIAPVGRNQDWSSDNIQAAIKGLIDKNVSDYQIDTSRIYIWGFSRGAIGTWKFVNNNPGFFKAAVPVSCCPKITLTASNFKGTKVYALAGSKESDYISCMKNAVNQIKNAGGSAKFETVAGQSHSTITANFPYSEVIDGWLLKQ